MLITVSKIFFVLSMVLSISSFAQTGDPQFEKLLYKSAKGALPYRFLKPKDGDPEKKYPLVIFLHGAGERGDDNEIHIAHIREIFLKAENRRDYPCYVVAPQCPAKVMWASYGRDGHLTENPSPVMQLVLELMEKIENEFPVDRTRVYITGLSMGGFATWELLARFPYRFAAAVPVCGGGDTSTAGSISHIPVWAFHGSLDNIVLPRNTRAMIRALQAANGRPGYTEYPDVGHDSWVYAYRDPYLLPWMFSKTLNGKGRP